MVDQTDIANADQIAYWNSRAGERWATLQDRIDALFAPLTEAAVEAARPAAGETVLDVGCGCGTSTLELARRVGPGGRVLGIDVSAPMLTLAQSRAEAADAGNVTLTLADASSHAFPPGETDLVFSRFGVMFFEDPATAFANIRTALAPDGRLSFVCWRRLADNAWFSVPVTAAKSCLPPQPPGDLLAPGPFAFADPERVRDILATAGFHEITIDPHETTIRLAGPGELDAATDFAMQIGPAARLLGEADAEAKGPIAAAIRAALAGYDGPDGIVLGGAVWLVSAKNALAA